MSTRTGWLVAIAGLLVVCIAGCLVCDVVLWTLMRPDHAIPVPEQSNPVLAMTEVPVDILKPVPTAVPIPTATVTPSLPVPLPDDVLYMSCAVDITGEAITVDDDVGDAFALGVEDPEKFCEAWWSGGFSAKVQYLADRNERCQDPTTECLIETDRLSSMAYDELVSSYEDVDQWCTTGGSGLRDSATHMRISNDHQQRSIDVLNSCEWVR